MTDTSALKSNLPFTVIVEVSGLHNGKPRWSYLSMEVEAFWCYQRDKQVGAVDLSQYGEVIFSGEGLEVPENICKQVERDYNITDQLNDILSEASKLKK